jgi:hypothetical protein
MPVIFSALVLVNAILPLTVLVPLKFVTVFVLLSVVPLPDWVVRSALVIDPAPTSDIVPVLTNETFPLVLIAPVVVMPPVLLMRTFPPPVSLMLVMRSGAALFVSCTSPLVVFVALKLEMVFALLSNVPLTEWVVSMSPLMMPVPVSCISPFVLVSNILPLLLFKLPVLSVMLSPAVKLISFAVLILFAITSDYNVIRSTTV